MPEFFSIASFLPPNLTKVVKVYFRCVQNCVLPTEDWGGLCFGNASVILSPSFFGFIALVSANVRKKWSVDGKRQQKYSFFSVPFYCFLVFWSDGVKTDYRAFDRREKIYTEACHA